MLAYVLAQANEVVSSSNSSDVLVMAFSVVPGTLLALGSLLYARKSSHKLKTGNGSDVGAYVVKIATVQTEMAQDLGDVKSLAESAATKAAEAADKAESLAGAFELHAKSDEENFARLMPHVVVNVEKSP